MATSFEKHTLAVDPNGWRINCCSFQQDAIMTYGSHQYVVLYQPLDDSNPSGPRVTSIGRRNLQCDDWQFVIFDDYIQTKDDGHNVICMGISGDGVIHLAWDMHGDEIHYRQSLSGLANGNGSNSKWTKASFGPVLMRLDCGGEPFDFDEITYPRFQTLEGGDLLLEFRLGRSGLGDCYLYRYSCVSQTWKAVGMYIKGVGNNAYLHGLDYTNRKLHVTWTYRDYVDDTSGSVTVQAGPNGPENNHDLHYMYSDDEGVTWYNTNNERLQAPVDVTSHTLVVEIPKHSGIMNQEGQCVDKNGIIHVLGRETGRYFHYYREPEGSWRREEIGDFDAPLFGARGKILARKNDIYCLLPLADFEFVVVKRARELPVWKVLHAFEGLDGEPLPDRYSDEIHILQREADISDQTTGRSQATTQRNSIVLSIKP